MAQPFDPQSGALSGTPTPLVNNLRDDVGVWRSIFVVSQNGVMVYQLGSADSAKSHLVLFDRWGKTLADYDPHEAAITNTRALLGVRDVRLSPDNKRVAFASGDGIWTLDLERKTRTRITFDEQVAQEGTSRFCHSGLDLVIPNGVRNLLCVFAGPPRPQPAHTTRCFARPRSWCWPIANC